MLHDTSGQSPQSLMTDLGLLGAFLVSLGWSHVVGPVRFPAVRTGFGQNFFSVLKTGRDCKARFNPNRSLDSPSVFPVFEEGCFCASCSLLSASCSSLRLDVARYAFG